jgi:hypothetical protein
VESVRKDIECLFGVLKARFCFLKNPIRMHNPVVIEAAFKCSVILHNILLIYDGHELEYNTVDEWETLDANDLKTNAGDMNINHELVINAEPQINVSPNLDLTMSEIYQRIVISTLDRKTGISARGVFQSRGEAERLERKRGPNAVLRSSADIAFCV